MAVRREQLVDAAVTTLSAAITTTTATTLTVASTAALPATGDFRLLVDSEVMLCTGCSGTTLTVARGVEGTTAATHASAAPVLVVLTAGSLQTFLADNCSWAAVQPPLRIVNSSGTALVVSDFTKVDSHSDTTVTQTGGALTIAKTGGSSYEGVYLTRPMPSATNGVVTLVACVDAATYINYGTGGLVGIGFRDSTHGQAELVLWSSAGPSITVRAPATADSTTPAKLALTTISPTDRLWLKAVRCTSENGETGCGFYISNNGVDWIPVYGCAAPSDTTFNPSGYEPDQLVFYCSTVNSTPTSVVLLAWDEGASSGQPEAGLVGWYKLNETVTTGGYADSSGFQICLNPSSGYPTVSTDVPAALTNPAWRSALFNGSDDVYKSGGVCDWPLPLSTAPRTISVWFKCPSTWSTTRSNVAFCYGQSSSGKNINIYMQPSGLGLNCYSGGVVSTSTITADTWHHGVWIVPSGFTANSQVLFYLDGVLQTTGTSSGSNISTATGFVELGTGESTLSNMPFIGNLCDLRIYNRALTSTEVANLYSGLNADGTTVVL